MSDVDDALVLLQEAVDKEITSTNDKGAELLRRGQLGQAKKQMEKSERLESFKKQADALRRSYRQIGVPGMRSKVKVGQRVGGTPPEKFYEPILQVLKEMDGKGQKREVVTRVGQMMGARLENEVDQEPLGSGFPRWMNRCRRARHDLKLAGKLRSDSPRGIWELS